MKWQIKAFDELTTTELYDLLQVRSEVFVVEQTCIYLDCDGKDKQGYHVFAYEGNDVVAYARILHKGVSYEEVSIGRVLIHPAYRSKGYAKQLMKEAILFTEIRLCEQEIRISAQEYLVDFYKSLGFMAVSEMYLEDDIPHVEMLRKSSDKIMEM